MASDTIREYAAANPHFAQGYRCGHIEGRSLEVNLTDESLHNASFEAAYNQSGLGYFERQEWASGYRYGFRAGCRNQPMPEEIANAPLPDTGAR